MEIKDILNKLQNNEFTVEQAEKEIKNNQYEDLGYAKIDHNRKERLGIGEVVFCQNKPDEFLTSIYTTIYKENGEVLGTRATKAICTAGTSDIPVAEEAAETAEFFGNYVERIYDVGVAGIHRILSQKEKLEKANCIIVIAGMEGALASVVGGLSKVPIIAVPTSVGYGASFGGVAALLSMLNSCANGVSVVNIDNGYGAAYIASQINLAISKSIHNGDVNGK